VVATHDAPFSTFGFQSCALAALRFTGGASRQSICQGVHS
jgi:hypothetical protein